MIAERADTASIYGRRRSHTQRVVGAILRADLLLQGVDDAYRRTIAHLNRQSAGVAPRGLNLRAIGPIGERDRRAGLQPVTAAAVGISRHDAGDRLAIIGDDRILAAALNAERSREYLELVAARVGEDGHRERLPVDRRNRIVPFG